MTFTEKLREAVQKILHQSGRRGVVGLDCALGFKAGFQLAIDQLNSLEAAENNGLWVLEAYGLLVNVYGFQGCY